MNILDSSGWLEYFAGGPNTAFFSRPLQNTDELIVPSITIYEVFKTVLRQRTESDALQAVALMMQGSVVDLTANISILAAKISLGKKCRWRIASFLPPPVFARQPYGLKIRISKASMGFSIFRKSLGGNEALKGPRYDSPRAA